MSHHRVVDCSALPTVAFGHRALLWWGTLGFMVAEGTTLIAALTSYAYLRKNFADYPPTPALPPELLTGTLALFALLAAIPVIHQAASRAKQLDYERAGRWLIAASAVSAISLGLRALEFTAVRTQWDDNAYGSAVWLVLGLHTTLIVVDLFESMGIALLVLSKHRKPKYLADVEDAALYQYFLSLIWIPCYLLLYWWPRVG